MALKKVLRFSRGDRGIRGEKIARGGWIVQMGGGRQLVRKAKQAGVPFWEREPSWLGKDPEAELRASRKG
jgi:hypothetical protein